MSWFPIIGYKILFLLISFPLWSLAGSPPPSEANAAHPDVTDRPFATCHRLGVRPEVYEHLDKTLPSLVSRRLRTPDAAAFSGCVSAPLEMSVCIFTINHPIA